MTEREKFEAEQKKWKIYSLRRGRCEVCGKVMAFEQSQLAHRVPKHKKYIKRYGEWFIHSEQNMALVCSLQCNSAVLMDPATHPVEAEELYQVWRRKEEWQ
jgi:hypothetical protein